jgi:hypothetical protein
VRERRQEIILEPRRALGLFARLALGLEEPLALALHVPCFDPIGRLTREQIEHVEVSLGGAT